jgi:predicted nucleotidyltransferase
MEMQLPADFKEFLRLLGHHGVRYLLIGGYAVNYYGYPRATGDIDVWIALDSGNAARMVDVLREFGFGTPELSTELFLQEGRMVRMGNTPLRIEILTTISGVTFDTCYAHRVETMIDGVDVTVIAIADLKQNKRASGRHKDLEDLKRLP